MSHAAVLLAGGKSSRMGRDKAALLIDGKPLWQRQIAVLRATQPAELFISGKCDGPYAACGVEILTDEYPDSGPLGGIATSLRRCKSDHLLILAVDMPKMTPEFLHSLVAESERTAIGVVPCVSAEGMIRAGLEPLAAVYPRAAFAVADDCLRSGERKLETFIRALEAQGLATIRRIREEEVALFTNWNKPDDVPPARLE